MDDPDWAWPAWKFGMKRDDLFSTLHERYNTFSYAIQDPEAFHHDVYELSRHADTSEQFHRLMADRQQLRLRELNESLETLAVEIIANPKLMGSEQWQHAIQMFRTKSYDSIVRYFASYLPDDYLNDTRSASSHSSFSEADSVSTVSTKASSAHDATCSHFLDDFFPMTAEPSSLDDDVGHDAGLDGPLSPPDSEAMGSEQAAESPSDAGYHTYSAPSPPSRSMSFSGSDSGHSSSEFLRRLALRHCDESPSDCDTMVTSVCDSTETRSACDCVEGAVDDKPHHPSHLDEEEEDDDDFPPAQYPDDHFDFPDVCAIGVPNDTLESDTPTPRQGPMANSYLEHKSMASRSLPSPHRHSRSPSPRSYLMRRANGLARECSLHANVMLKPQSTS
ncbi:hypothetical protein DCS_04487 [Drechmeria coniospora]|uniref:Uncharacterized protein n=1 Tax=Drechmeria coniospora TaxID=98403 RepID=A0A151GK53_DRECN|nr:hypothetical protein DCS_04487 [Drechmeria coniospora]KYK57477.1 hypothetical protein DCS_04487 [Drechmeria coniospora]